MKVTPKQLRKVIDIIRTRMLAVDSTLEQYEAVVEYTPGVQYIGKELMGQDIERLRSRNRIIREEMRKKLQLLENILKEDETVNFWKGEDRYLEFLIEN